MPLVELLERADRKLHHGRRDSLSQDSYAVNMAVPAAVVIDDLITTGKTMSLSLARYGRQRHRRGDSP